jgi:hypothetical protein
MESIFLTLFLAVTVSAADIQVYFSPRGGCTEFGWRSFLVSITQCIAWRNYY